MRAYLDFEKPVAELEAKIAELRALTDGQSGAAITDEVTRLEGKAQQALRDVYAALTPWQKTQVARHPERPHCVHYISRLITDFTPLAGDRYFGEDSAIIGGFGPEPISARCICVGDMASPQRAWSSSQPMAAARHDSPIQPRVRAARFMKANRTSLTPPEGCARSHPSRANPGSPRRW